MTGANSAIAAERHVLGVLILHAEAVPDCSILRSSDFYSPKHQRIFRAIVGSHQDHGVTDMLVVGDVLSREPGGLDEVGGHTYLADLMEGVYTASDIHHHVEIVKEHADRRRIEKVLQNALKRFSDGTATAADLRALIASAIEGAKPAVKPWECFSLDDYLAMRTSPWAVHGLFRSMQVVLVGSFPTVGKSTIASGWIYATLTGTPWCGRRVRQGSVVALIGEGMTGFCQRLDAERRRGGLPIPGGEYLELVKFKAQMSSPDGQVAMRELVAEKVAQHGHNPALVVIDTLSSHWSADEDSQESIAPFMRAVSQIAEEFECAVVIVHHTTKAKGKFAMPELQDFRGSGAMIGAADCVIGACATKDSSGVIVCTVKTKDDEPSGNINLLREIVPLGFDEDGDAMTGAVLVEARLTQGSTFNETEQQVNEQREAQREILDQCMAAMRELGGHTSSKDAVFALMTGKTQRKRAAFAQLMDRGEIRPAGPERGRIYYLSIHPDAPGVCVQKKEPKKGRGGAAQAASQPPPGARGGAGAGGAEGAEGAEGATSGRGSA